MPQAAGNEAGDEEEVSKLRVTLRVMIGEA
jgi:hypothetical protein